MHKSDHAIFCPPSPFRYPRNSLRVSADLRALRAKKSRTKAQRHKVKETRRAAVSITRFHYDGDELVGEYSSVGALLRRYVHGAGVDDPLVWMEGAGVTAAATRRLRGNHQGSIVAVTDNAGAPIAINAYDEWGIPAAANVGRFQYTGQIWLPELGLYYYKARIYSPTLGRFMQTDPIGYEDQVNLYAYVGNDPVNGTDPTGKDTEVQFTQAAGVRIPNICGAGGCSGPSPLHTNLKLTPDIQKGLDPKIFSQIDSDGRRFATLSAGPDDLPIFGFSNLVSEVNRGEGPTVHKMNIRTPSIFRSEADFHNALLNSDKNYNDQNSYVLFPQKGDAGRNSNSYISGILRANSVDTTGIGKSGYYVPGFDVPLDVAAGSIRR